jgi:cobyrinic acid a,c-diamide synthase
MVDKRLVIAGSRSGVGKTTISLGIMAALRKKGYHVQPYKVGPDYIDPGFHTLVTGNNSHNLDSYFLGQNGVKELYKSTVNSTDIAIIEGVMGLFDGKGKKGVSSTAEIAKTLNSPVILIIDAKKMAQSGAALAYGYKNYDQDLNLSGLIINNIASARHYKLIKEAVEGDPVNLQVLGYLPRQKELVLPERHLGLVPTHESQELEKFIVDLVKIIDENINLEKLMELAGSCQELKVKESKLYSRSQKKYNVKIAVAYDQAFNFYYQYNLDMLKNLGAELINFSPVRDKKLPDVDGIYLGGGFPESFLDELANNIEMKEDIKEKLSSGMPGYAECGGLMYLSREVIDRQGNIYPIQAETEMKSFLQEMGYVEVKAIKDNIVLKAGEKAKGHLFHYSSLNESSPANESSSSIPKSYQIGDGKLEGYTPLDNILASYVHLHFASNPQLADNFLKKAEEYKKESL